MCSKEIANKRTGETDQKTNPRILPNLEIWAFGLLRTSWVTKNERPDYRGGLESGYGSG